MILTPNIIQIVASATLKTFGIVFDDGRAAVVRRVLFNLRILYYLMFADRC